MSQVASGAKNEFSDRTKYDALMEVIRNRITTRAFPPGLRSATRTLRHDPRSGAACAVGSECAAVAFHCRHRPGPQRQDHGVLSRRAGRPCQAEDEVSNAGLSRAGHRAGIYCRCQRFPLGQSLSGPQRRIGARQDVQGKCRAHFAAKRGCRDDVGASRCGRAWLQCVVGDRDRAGEGAKGHEASARHSRRIVGAGHHVLRPAGQAALRVPAFSFVFGVPDKVVLAECRRRSIATIGAATSVDEATALEAAGVDVVVASGFEAGGHRPSFLRSADSSLTGLFALVPQVVDAVEIPVIAAGGIADGRTVAAALMLGASGVQVGTAFLACEESNAAPGHRAALLGASREPTVLTRAFSGRLARGLRNRLADYLESIPSVLPYPVASGLLAPLRRAALLRDRVEMMPLFAGQGAPLLRHRRAKDVFEALVSETDATLRALG